MQSTLPFVRDLVLVGGGHAHALVLRKWAMNPQPGVRLTVINPAPIAAYTGMLPGLVAGHYAREEVLIDLVRLCRFAGARLVIGAATGIDRDNRLIHVPGRAPVKYDLASLDVGIRAGRRVWQVWSSPRPRVRWTVSPPGGMRFWRVGCKARAWRSSGAASGAWNWR
ncbi:MAG: hypothetical protein HC774_06870 [Sphingomonadales bacterium]|nr:hypothetical protein [Sphingomonadales bacterium]